MSVEFHSSVNWFELAAFDANDDVFALRPPWRVCIALRDSVGRVGVLTPLLAEPAGERLRIVDGFGRFLAAVHHGLARLPVVLSSPLKPRERFFHRLETRLATRPLDELETALALRKLKHRFQVPEPELLSEVLPLLGLRPERFQLRRYLDLAAIAPRLQQALPDLQTAIALKLNRWPDEAQTFFLYLLSRYRLGVNHQREIFDLLDELRQTSGPEARLLDIWKQIGAAEVDGDETTPPQERLPRIRAALRHARYPTLQAMESDAEELRASLRLPPQIHFNWPRFFEGDRMTIQFSFRTPEELESLAGQLKESAGKDELKRLIELL